MTSQARCHIDRAALGFWVEGIGLSGLGYTWTRKPLLSPFEPETSTNFQPFNLCRTDEQLLHKLKRRYSKLQMERVLMEIIITPKQPSPCTTRNPHKQARNLEQTSTMLHACRLAENTGICCVSCFLRFSMYVFVFPHHHTKSGSGTCFSKWVS